MILNNPKGLLYPLVLLFAFLFSFSVNAQSKKAVKEIQYAKQSIANDDMPRAWQHISKAIKYDPNYVDALIMAGDFKMYEEKAAEASPFYQKALMLSGKAFIKYKLALAYRDELRYDEGLTMLRQYEEDKPISSDRADEFYLLMASMAFAAEAVKKPVPFNPIDLGPGINSEAMEYFPSINARGDVLVVH